MIASVLAKSERKAKMEKDCYITHNNAEVFQLSWTISTLKFSQTGTKLELMKNSHSIFIFWKQGRNAGKARVKRRGKNIQLCTNFAVFFIIQNKNQNFD